MNNEKHTQAEDPVFQAHELATEVRLVANLISFSTFSETNAITAIKYIREYYNELSVKVEQFSKAAQATSSSADSVTKVLNALEEQRTITGLLMGHTFLANFITTLNRSAQGELSLATQLKNGQNTALAVAILEPIIICKSKNAPFKKMNAIALSFALNQAALLNKGLASTDAIKVECRGNSTPFTQAGLNLQLRVVERNISSAESQGGMELTQSQRTIFSALVDYQIQLQRVREAITSQDKDADKKLVLEEQALSKAVENLSNACELPQQKLLAARALSYVYNYRIHKSQKLSLDPFLKEYKHHFDIRVQALELRYNEGFENIQEYQKTVFNIQAFDYLKHMYEIAMILRKDKVNASNPSFIEAYKKIAATYLVHLQFMQNHMITYIPRFDLEEIVVEKSKSAKENLMTFYCQIDEEIAKVRAVITPKKAPEIQHPSPVENTAMNTPIVSSSEKKEEPAVEVKEEIKKLVEEKSEPITTAPSETEIALTKKMLQQKIAELNKVIKKGKLRLQSHNNAINAMNSRLPRIKEKEEKAFYKVCNAVTAEQKAATDLKYARDEETRIDPDISYLDIDEAIENADIIYNYVMELPRDIGVPHWVFHTRMRTLEGLALRYNVYNAPMGTLKCYNELAWRFDCLAYNQVYLFTNSELLGNARPLTMLGPTFFFLSQAFKYTSSMQVLAEHLMATGTASYEEVEFVSCGLRRLFSFQYCNPENSTWERHDLEYAISQLLNLLNSRLEVLTASCNTSMLLGSLKCKISALSSLDTYAASQEVVQSTMGTAAAVLECHAYILAFEDMLKEIHGFRYSVHENENSVWPNLNNT